MKYRKTWTQVLEEVLLLSEALKPLDKSVIDAFYYKKEKAGKLVSTDGDTLTKNGMGGQEIAKWNGRKIKITAVSDVKSTESILKYMKKSIPSGLLEEVEIEETNKIECPKCEGEGCKHCDGKGYHLEDEDADPVGKNEEIEEANEFWAVIDKAKGGEVMAISSDEKGAKSSVKMSNFSKHDYHFNKDPKTLKIVKVAGSYKKGEKMIGTKLSFKEDVELEEGTVLDVKDVDKWMPEIKKGIDAPWVSIQKSTLGGDENVAIMIKLSLDPEKDWANKIYQNSRFAMIRLGANGEMEMFASERKLNNMRKTKFKSAKDVVQKINIWIKKVDEEVQHEEFVVETDMLQAKMALGDANIKHKEHKGKIIINKKDKKKASDALMKSFAKKGTPPDLTIASGSFQEAQSKENDMDLDETIKQVVMGEAKVDLKKLKKKYLDNEDKNNHRENYLLLAKAFGTKAEIKKVEEIIKRSEAANSTSRPDSDWMYKNINKYYDKLRSEEVEEKLEKEDASSFTFAAASAKKKGKKKFKMGGKEYPVTIKAKVGESKLYTFVKNIMSKRG